MEAVSNVIQTQGLGKSYEEIDALKDLNLKVPKNSIFGFLGPNGAGKTTTMKLLLGLTRASAGGGTIFGLDIVQDSVEIRSRVGYLPQDPRFYEHLTARETLDFTIRFYFKEPEAEIKQRIEETLDLVDLADKADRPIKSFSGGERQRLGIAQAQVNYPDLLILDEPAASLDPLGRKDVMDIMRRLRKYTTVFYSTHILDDVQQVSDTVAILNHGELIADGPIEALLAGSGGTVYLLKIKGNSDLARSTLEGQEWVTNIQETELPDGASFFVSVSDEAVAEEKLLRLLLVDATTIVTEFGRKKYELEEIFFNLVQGGDHVRQ
jgi:ABC-2 type transport system ATP-binding protein